MLAPGKDRVHEKYGWILLFVSGLLIFIAGLFDTLSPSSIDSAGVKNLTGMTWEQIVSQSPAAAKLTTYFVVQLGISELGFSILTMGITVLGFRRGQRWAWYLLWFVPAAWLGYVVTNLAVGGIVWILFTVVLAVALLGLLLPYRKFFPRKALTT